MSSTNPRSLPKEEIARLIAAAGARPSVDAHALESVRRAAKDAWLQSLEVPRVPQASAPSTADRRSVVDPLHPSSWWKWLAAASLLALAASAAWLFERRDSVMAAPTVAVERIVGDVMFDVGGAQQPARASETIRAPITLVVGEAAGSSLSVRTGSGHSVRLAAGGRLRWRGGRSFELLEGRVYVASPDVEGSGERSDAGTGVAFGGPGLVIATALGTVREIGTQYEVSLSKGTTPEPAELLVRVREGEVLLDSQDGTPNETAIPEDSADPMVLSIRAGEQVSASAHQVLQRSPFAVDDPGWAWVMAAAPPFAVEGRTAADLVRWLSRERGLPVRYVATARGIAESSPFSGRASVLLEEAADYLLTAGLSLSAEEGQLVVRELD